MARLDDNELNIRPEVAAALRYHPLRASAARTRRNAPPPARREESFGLPIFTSIIAIACVVGLGAAGTAHHPATAEPSQPQVSQQSGPVVGNQEQQSGAIPVGTAEPIPGVPDPAAQVPAQRNDGQSPQETQYAVDIQTQEKAQNPDVEVNQGNEIQYLPADYATGRVTEPILLLREMPHGAVDPLGYVPPGTCLLYERANANGWRRVASLDGRYAGYAQVYPTVAYQPQPMRPELLQAIAMIRRIP